MNKSILENLDLTLYSKKLQNGLEIFIVPNENVNNIYCTFSTKYGSVQNEFVPVNESEMIKVPNGVAHFLEHKMFEQENGVDPFTFFSERGADANANTSAFKTTYLFSGPDFFEENLNYLLDYVQKPYFTDKNVEKEKGIIEQEIKMYEDDPYSRLYEGILFNTFKEHPIRNSVIGTPESVNSITKEILYKCYNTFYNPSNMFVVITGKVDKDKVFQIIEENQNNKTFEKMKKIDVKIYDEPDEVFKEKEVLKMNVTIPKISLNYKFNLNDLPDHLSEKEKMMYLSLIFDINFGPTSLFNEQLKQMEIINSNIEISSVEACNHVVYTLFLETESKEKAIELVSNEINKLSINEEQLERKKKGIISSNVFMSDNIFSINHKIMSDIVRYNHVITDIHSIAKSLNIKDAKNVLKKLKFNNYSIFIVDKK